MPEAALGSQLIGGAIVAGEAGASLPPAELAPSPASPQQNCPPPHSATRGYSPTGPPARLLPPSSTSAAPRPPPYKTTIQKLLPRRRHPPHRTAYLVGAAPDPLASRPRHWAVPRASPRRLTSPPRILVTIGLRNRTLLSPNTMPYCYCHPSPVDIWLDLLPVGPLSGPLAQPLGALCLPLCVNKVQHPQQRTR